MITNSNYKVQVSLKKNFSPFYAYHGNTINAVSQKFDRKLLRTRNSSFSSGQAARTQPSPQQKLKPIFQLGLCSHRLLSLHFTLFSVSMICSAFHQKSTTSDSTRQKGEKACSENLKHETFFASHPLTAVYEGFTQNSRQGL